MLAALNQYLRFRQNSTEEDEKEELSEIVEEIEQLEDRLDEQDAMLSDLRQKHQ